MGYTVKITIVKDCDAVCKSGRKCLNKARANGVCGLHSTWYRQSEQQKEGQLYIYKKRRKSCITPITDDYETSDTEPNYINLISEEEPEPDEDDDILCRQMNTKCEICQ